MMAAAGGLVDAGSPVSSWDDAGDPWRDWIVRHLPLAPDTWLADLRSPVPAEPDLYGHLGAAEEDAALPRRGDTGCGLQPGDVRTGLYAHLGVEVR